MTTFNRFMANPINLSARQKAAMFSLAKEAYREREIITHCTGAEIIQEDEFYKVLRVHSDDGYFEYEVNSNRITG